jgi:transcriptional regulator with XRE-family HTH domain
MTDLLDYPATNSVYGGLASELVEVEPIGPTWRVQAVPEFDHFVADFTRWVMLPPAAPGLPVPLPGLQEQIRSIREMTNWSSRDIGGLIGTSHTTVQKFESTGRISDRSTSAAIKVRPLLTVLRRLRRQVSGPDELVIALVTETGDGLTAKQLLAEGNWSEAYIVGLDAIRGPQPEMRGRRKDVPVLAATRELR